MIDASAYFYWLIIPGHIFNLQQYIFALNYYYFQIKEASSEKLKRKDEVQKSTTLLCVCKTSIMKHWQTHNSEKKLNKTS